mmetsp:Transcript_23065/g.49990  ORF Transcript_23065/g.49990 Transcript_23065/m.49990 type:complete len:200 (-) Transcript_23065:185-784(-)
MEIDSPASSGGLQEQEASSTDPTVQTSTGPGTGAAPGSITTAAAAPSVTVGGSENAAELKFGPDFEDIHILSNAQVAVILQVSAKSAVNRDEELNDVYRRTQKYVERFNTMTNPEKEHQELVDELDNLQDALTTFRKETEDGREMELHGSEVAALMNLVATDTMVEEAVALIPSLSRFPEAAIDEILDLIRSTMIRIVS